MTCPPNLITFNSLIATMCASGDMNKAEDWLGCITEAQLQPDATSFTTLIDGYPAHPTNMLISLFVA